MRNLFFGLVFLYGLGVSGIVAYETARDMKMLENAVASGSRHAEMRHRMNVAAEGNWFLMGNIISVIGALGVRSKK